MSLSQEQQAKLLKIARNLLYVPRKIEGFEHDFDCSYFVYYAYLSAGLSFTYQRTATFSTLLGAYFESVASSNLEPGDVLMFSGHMGIWDPDGCRVLKGANRANKTCQTYKGEAPVLSARVSSQMVDYGTVKFFGTLIAAYRWK